MTKKSRVAVTPQLREELRSESNRTAIGPMKLFRGRRHELPTGLNSRVVNSWLDGSAQSAKPEHIQYVLNSYDYSVREGRKSVPGLVLSCHSEYSPRSRAVAIGDKWRTIS
jgi:hypothetical protein